MVESRLVEARSGVFCKHKTLLRFLKILTLVIACGSFLFSEKTSRSIPPPPPRTTKKAEGTQLASCCPYHVHGPLGVFLAFHSRLVGWLGRKGRRRTDCSLMTDWDGLFQGGLVRSATDYYSSSSSSSLMVMWSAEV